MDVLHAMALAGASAGTVVTAAEQSGGRGSRGRTWVSPRGGLWLSVLLRPPNGSGLDLLSLRTGLAVSDALSAMGRGEPIRLKWPNDLMLGERKIGGILCEARWQGESLGWVVVGLGLNVANPIPDTLQDVVANLAERLPGIAPGLLVEPMAAAVIAAGCEGARLSPGELERFGARDWLHGRSLRSPVTGIAAGIGPDGSLRVRLADGGQAAARGGPVELADPSVPT